MNRWLKDHGMPEITRVYKTTKDGRRLTLEDECLKSGTLPSIAYGFKRCSLKHKIGPQEKFCNHYPPCRKAVSYTHLDVYKRQKLEIAVSQAASVAQTYNCLLTRLDYQQEDGLMSSLHLGLSLIHI